jgi:DNA topoisomerase IB
MRLTIDRYGPSIKQCESCLIEEFRTRSGGRGCEDLETVGHKGTFKRLWQMTKSVQRMADELESSSKGRQVVGASR